MKTAKQFARELLNILDEDSDPQSLIVHVRDLCEREQVSFPPTLVEKHVAEALSILQSFGLPMSRLGAFTLLALVQVGAAQSWSEAQRKSLRLHDILNWINEQYGVQYAENTRESLRRDVIAPMVPAILNMNMTLMSDFQKMAKNSSKWEYIAKSGPFPPFKWEKIAKKFPY